MTNPHKPKPGLQLAAAIAVIAATVAKCANTIHAYVYYPSPDQWPPIWPVFIGGPLFAYFLLMAIKAAIDLDEWKRDNG